jgi:hypothetical protein
MRVQAVHVLVPVIPVMIQIPVPMIHVMVLPAPIRVMPPAQPNPAVRMLHAILQRSVQPVVSLISEISGQIAVTLVLR